MFLLRTSRSIIPAARAAPQASRSFSILPRLCSGSDYGSGAQKKEKKLEKASHDKEHPGPAPPSSTSGDGSSSNSKSQDKGVERGSESSSTGGGGAQPKILSDSPPAEDELPKDVKSHNEEVKARNEGTYQTKENETTGGS